MDSLVNIETEMLLVLNNFRTFDNSEKERLLTFAFQLKFHEKGPHYQALLLRALLDYLPNSGNIREFVDNKIYLLMKDIMVLTFIKEFMNDEYTVNLICDYIVGDNAGSVTSHMSENWAFNLAQINPKINNTMINKSIDIQIKIINESHVTYIISWRYESIYQRLAKFCKLPGTKLNKIILFLKREPKILEKFLSEVPEANRYLSMI